MHVNEKNRTPKLEDPNDGPSKSELKRQMTERQKLAEVLAALSSDALKTIPMDEAIKAAIAETNKIKSFEAIRRHKQYLGKLMRFLDETELEAIQKRLDAIQGVSKAETAKLHFLESYRDRLIADDAAFTKLIEQFPEMDIQNMRTLIRNARREKEQNKPPKAYREIFRCLKELGL
ncbi:ribosome biogenesis factor YjgA [Polynucleobacter sphagniphilus]|jgi:ribosome-associated protein|uniref:Dual-action ribosomal maturation protein DarP n=1 Tax=Polynucleobacter sphagniphilus TaxID=1743169 RepID=A0AA43MCB3_9BURK|nr:ribosome biogenesis factor YjgA [Polynucleobacter sphagniphilus]MDF9787547.1 ribosome-associated protein [Polynucleobacter sphagniphilus]MDH6154079.1 ribosome-associated protein [Polynucleobacter sphagniphilus]MDH6240351.1 ribosome-associated protein [Polynucleobacter sphagniphilus]MDH6248361.1 ribosome-associated protein [Polynucleobacter sphagniphilus]MDH6300827.1 ribosome-associated protein [Polynucleobacter sphagniphilus]